MASVVPVAEGIISLIKRNIIAKTDLSRNINAGDSLVFVDNTFHFNAGEEIVFIDSGYNTEGDSRYQIFEYSQILRVVNTHVLELSSPIVGDWTTARASFIQKTIGHSPLYEENVLYGDRDVIPTDFMAITIDPKALSNDWLYLQGGLSEEYKMTIMVYGMDIKTHEGRIILDKYADAVYNLFISNLHIDVDNYYTPILNDAVENETQIIIADTAENRKKFVLSSTLNDPRSYMLQDNNGGGCGYFEITSITYGGGIMTININMPIPRTYNVSEFGALLRLGRYFYDTRIDSINYGQVSKGSAVLRAAELSWWGKEVNEVSFPQANKNIPYFDEQPNSSSSSDSSIIWSHSSSTSSSSSVSSFSSFSSVSFSS